MDAMERGRDDLNRWLAGQPRNFYEADGLLQVLVGDAVSADGVERLRQFGAVAAGPLDAAVIENNRTGNLPALATHDAIGRHVAGFAHHPSYHRAGELIYGSGVMAAYAAIPNPTPSSSLCSHLLARGEASH